jgi:hypothetical protein
MAHTSSKSDKKPIKRSEYIIALSRDHHTGLLFCWKIKEGLKKGVDFLRINKYVKFFWEQHLNEHFREEEALLFDQVDNDLTRQGKEEHKLLNGWFDRIISNDLKSSQEYLSFAELLINHIRFEERVLFPYLEVQLPAAALKAAGTYLEQHHVPFNDNYADEFWSEK